ncbi:MAG: YicC/YloC family endoribonuclease [Burkholderiales bacterium]
MITSMTGFANVAREYDFGAISLELRSVNHRYLEIQFRLPDEFKSVENPMREAIAARLTRGKVDCRVAFAPKPNSSGTPQLNDNVLAQLAELSAKIAARFPANPPMSVAEILRWPGVVDMPGVSTDMLRDATMPLLQDAIAQLHDTRRREGEKLAALLLERVARMEDLAKKTAPLVPQIVKSYEEKLAAKIVESNLTPDDDRIRAEVVLFASKVDVEEELDRLNAHLSEVRRILKAGGAAGKRLDFLMQELNREANTLGSKSVAVDISRTSMELKVLIEQMREQIQNIE